MKRIARVRAAAVFCAAALVAAAPRAEAAVPWLSFLPKAERPKATALVAAMDAGLAVLVEDRGRAFAAERSYVDAARNLAAVLDTFSDKSEALAASLTLSGFGGLSAESAAGVLADKRRLRWEGARDLASRRYGHVEKAGITTAEATEAGILRDGRTLAALLAKRIAAVPKKDLAKAVKALEDRLSAHPDCPAAAFAALRDAAAKLEGGAYRAWMTVLASGLPGPLAADETVALGASPAEAAFREAKGEFVEAYSARMLFAEVLPAAAAAAWYGDGIAGPRVPFARVTPQALASLSSFLRNLVSLSPRSVARVLEEDGRLSAAYAECVGLVWAAYGRDPARFAQDLGLDPSVIRAALSVAWRVPAGAVGAMGAVPPDVDRQAVERAERFAETAELENGGARLLALFAELKRDPAAYEAIRGGTRYAPVRERLRAAFANVLAEREPAMEAEARKTPLAAEDGVFRFLRAGDDPFSTVVIAAAFERQLEGRPLRVAVPPASLKAALGPLAPLLDAGTLVVALPCLVETTIPAPDELALLGADRGWLGAGEEVAAATLDRLGARYGVPVSSFAAPSARPASAARRLADFSGVAARYAILADGFGGDR